MSATISVLPIWKRDSTAAEWLQELSGLAMEYPERFAKVAIVFQETDERGFALKTRYFTRGNVSNTDVLGMLEEGKLHVYDYMRGRLEE